MIEKQIEEMAEYIFGNAITHDTQFKEDCRSIARDLYNAGYRKQSEGEWIKRIWIIFDSEKVGFCCSKCNTTWDTPTKFCPNCGAKMKGGAE